MNPSKMLAECRAVDLSKLLTPGAATGPVGSGRRRLEIREFAYPPGETMHRVHMETHIGTHVEAPRHFVNARHGRSGKDISQLPLESLFGEAVLVDLAGFPPGQELGREHVERLGIRRGDIVLIGNAKHEGSNRPLEADNVPVVLALPLEAA